MAVVERQMISLRSSKHGLSAWIGEKYLGRCDVVDRKMLITADISHAIPDTVLPEALQIGADK